MWVLVLWGTQSWMQMRLACLLLFLWGQSCANSRVKFTWAFHLMMALFQGSGEGLLKLVGNHASKEKCHSTLLRVQLDFRSLSQQLKAEDLHTKGCQAAQLLILLSSGKQNCFRLFTPRNDSTCLWLSFHFLNPNALNWELRGPWAPSAPQHSQSLLIKPTLPTPFLLHFCLFFIHPYTLKICTELCTWSLPGVCKTNIPLRWLTSSQAQSIPVPDLDPCFKQQKGEVKNRNTNTGTFR